MRCLAHGLVLLYLCVSDVRSRTGKTDRAMGFDGDDNDDDDGSASSGCREDDDDEILGNVFTGALG
ncbi:hypothetical protein ZHAS_00011288 [Anopheles sinensis]|uniref:Secreted protein n=1 Tax=Anopheles sinensis TaxID=74873 RepID=A0A084VZU0_ANOSI|nr:hypothetical protein ZHAS_00011288 [Anopheles sinensis]